MIKHVTQSGALIASLLALASAAKAEIKINENFSVSGYIVGLADFTDLDKADRSSTLDLQATKLTAIANFSPVTGVLSYYAGSDNKPVVLDAYATYDLGGGASVTGGKFLSWLGYEAFDPINMATITYAWNTLPGGLGVVGIPAYHSGVKIESTSDTFSGGFAILDSNNYATPYHKGDGDLDNGVGLEAYFKLKSGPTTVFLGLEYDTDDKNNKIGSDDTDLYSADLWVEHAAGAVTLAGELSYTKSESGPGDTDTYFWMAFAKFAASDTVAYVGRVSGAKVDDPSPKNARYTKFSFCPVFTVTKNLEICGEASYVKFDDTGYDDGLYFGLQGRFKF